MSSHQIHNNASQSIFSILIPVQKIIATKTTTFSESPGRQLSDCIPWIPQKSFPIRPLSVPIPFVPQEWISQSSRLDYFHPTLGLKWSVITLAETASYILSTWELLLAFITPLVDWTVGPIKQWLMLSNKSFLWSGRSLRASRRTTVRSFKLSWYT